MPDNGGTSFMRWDIRSFDDEARSLEPLDILSDRYTAGSFSTTLLRGAYAGNDSGPD
jgi:hypothetical protein